MFEIFHGGYYVAPKFREKTQNRIVEYYEIELYTDSSGFTYLNGEKLRPKKHDVLIAKPNDVRRSEGGYSCHSLKFVCTDLEYKKMLKKYNDMTKTYVIQTNLHKEALLTYVRFKVKEEIATAKGDVQEAQKWYQAAQDAAEKAKITPRQLTKEDLRKDTLFQGTNGILSLSFIVILLLCAVGYLIYWILSIRSRELLFGILRAMGMSKNEVFHILLNEQIFCGILSVLTGVGIGAAAAILYVPIIQNAYAATDQMLPLELVCGTGDLIKLFGTVVAVLIICITVLLRIVSKSNITGALKLGED